MLDLAYGENPHQRAAYYAEAGARRHLLSRVEQLTGSELSFNNLNDLAAARLLVARVRAAGLRDRQAREPVRRRGRAARSRRPTSGRSPPTRVSAYGGVVVLNRAGRAPSSASGSPSSSSRCCSRPATTTAALDALAAKPATRILDDRERRAVDAGERDYRRVLGGLLVQDRDSDIDDREGMEVVCGDAERGRTGATCSSPGASCKHVASNAIVIAQDLQTIGIGAGQMSRVDAVRIARREGARSTATTCAAPCSPPTRSSRSPTARSSRSTRAWPAIIQPGGSKRDAEVIEAVERRGRGDGLHRPPPLPALTRISRARW